LRNGSGASSKRSDEAERGRAEAARLLEEQSSRGGAGQAHDLAAAKAMAQKEREALLAKAHEEQEQMLERARREIASETQKALLTVRQEAVDLALAAASKLIEAKLDSDANRRLVTQYIDDLGEDAKAR
jgi:F-type H+-transporting ATPase subunit b